MRREHSRSRFQSKAERNLAYGFGEIRRLTSVLELATTLRDQACALFRSAQNHDLLRGRSIEAMAAASVYGACRCNGLSRTLDEIAPVARIEKSRVVNAYKTVNTKLGLPAEPMRPSRFVPQLASELTVSTHVQRRARKLAEAAEEAGVTTGVQPSGFAAACLYKASREQGWWLTQAEIADVANTSRTTVRTHRDTLDELAV